MPMSSGGPVASSSGCATRPRAQEIGLTGSAAPTQPSSLIGRYVMATAEHREPCESRGSCTVLGAPGGESPSGDPSTPFTRLRSPNSVNLSLYFPTMRFHVVGKLVQSAFELAQKLQNAAGHRLRQNVIMKAA